MNYLAMIMVIGGTGMVLLSRLVGTYDMYLLRSFVLLWRLT